MTSRPSISIIIPVLAEADQINGLLDHLLELPSAATPEIIVVDGDPEKTTTSVIKYSHAVTTAAGPGRAVQMNAGAALASGDILLFLHADTLLPRKGLELIGKAMEKSECVGGAFALGIRSGRAVFRITERYVALRTRLTGIPFGDQAIFMRRTFFEHMGGYREIPIMEDVDLMRRIKRQGGAIRIIPEKVLTSARRWEKEGVLHATIRNWMLQILFCCGVPPRLLSRFYR